MLPYVSVIVSTHTCSGHLAPYLGDNWLKKKLSDTAKFRRDYILHNGQCAIVSTQFTWRKSEASGMTCRNVVQYIIMLS